jgi:hypothetical protein
MKSNKKKQKSKVKIIKELHGSAKGTLILEDFLKEHRKER